MSGENRKVFISYSWSVQERVIELAERLFANGVEVVLDVYDLKEGQDKYSFMEQSVSDPSIDRVLIVCDKTYAEKANKRSGGVGDETVIISPEVYGQVKQEKFIPVVFETDEDGCAYVPTYLKSRIYIDLTREDDKYESEYEKLLRNIYDRPIYKKPSLGKKPEWLETDIVDLSSIRDLTKQIRGYNGRNPTKAEFLICKASSEIVLAAKQYKLPEKKTIEEGILIAIDQTKGFRDVFVDFCESLIYSDLSADDTIHTIFERLYNELHDASGRNSSTESDFDLYNFMLWELFISIVAMFLHYERYSEIHVLLTRPYFLRSSYFETSTTPYSYCHLKKHFRSIDAIAGNHGVCTMSGDILLRRERKPFLTKDALVNADFVLYQLGEVLAIKDSGKVHWFPATYIYHSGPQSMWQKLQSMNYCRKILPLFGVQSVDELKKLVKKSTENYSVRYYDTYECAQGILSSVVLSDIGTLN